MAAKQELDKQVAKVCMCSNVCNLNLSVYKYQLVFYITYGHFVSCTCKTFNIFVQREVKL